MNVNRLCLLGAEGVGVGQPQDNAQMDDTYQLPYDALSVNALLFIPGPASGLSESCRRAPTPLPICCQAVAGTPPAPSAAPCRCAPPWCRSCSTTRQFKLVGVLGTVCAVAQVHAVARHATARFQLSHVMCWQATIHHAEQGACRTAGMHQLY